MKKIFLLLLLLFVVCHTRLNAQSPAVNNISLSKEIISTDSTIRCQLIASIDLADTASVEKVHCRIKGVSSDTAYFDADFIIPSTEGTFINGGSNEYAYDANGNMTSNANKQITSIAYNHMNLPVLIQFSSGNKIEYFYDATGTRVRKKTTQVTSPAGTNEKKYTGLFEYSGSSLEAFYTAEGRCVPTGTVSPQYRYEYQYTDNTGNAVLAFSDLDGNGTVSASTEIIQQSHFYPFGMRMQGLSTPQIGPENKYKFGSKELQDEFGLNEYDFGARFYDPAVGRWGCVDPLADLASDWTPFRYGFNNPVTMTDPDGMYEEGEFGSPEPDKGKNRTDCVTKEIIQPTKNSKQKESQEAPNPGSPVKANEMKKIDSTPVNVPTAPPSLKHVDPVSSSNGAITAGPSAGLMDSYAGIGAWVSSLGLPLEGGVLNLSYEGTNDAYISYNWIANRSMKDLQGHTVGATKARDASFWSAIAILSGPLEGLSEGVNIAKTGVYEIETTGGKYVGQSKNILRRIWQHFTSRR